MKFLNRVHISGLFLLLIALLIGVQAKPLREGFQQTVSPTSVQIDLNCVPSGSDVNCTASSTNAITTTPPTPSTPTSTPAPAPAPTSLTRFRIYDAWDDVISSTWVSSQKWATSGDDIPNIGSKALVSLVAIRYDALAKSYERAQNDSVKLAQITDPQKLTTERAATIQAFSAYLGQLFGKLRDEAEAANVMDSSYFSAPATPFMIQLLVKHMVDSPQVQMNWSKLQWGISSKILLNQVQSNETTPEGVIRAGKTALSADQDFYWNQQQQNRGQVDSFMRTMDASLRVLDPALQNTQEKLATYLLLQRGYGTFWQ